MDVAMHPVTRQVVGIKWEGVRYVYTCLPSGLFTASEEFSKVMREIEIFWRRWG